MNDSNLIFQRRKLSFSFPTNFSGFPTPRLSIKVTDFFSSLLTALANSVCEVARACSAGPIVCPAISTPCSLCSSCTSHCLDSCSICPSCMTQSFKSWSCASVIGRTSQGTLLPEPQLRYHFHKLCLANLQRHLFSNCAARS